MNKTNILSTILVVVFMISCLSFFNASATEDSNLSTEPVTSVSDTVAVETTTVPEETTPVETSSVVVESTTQATVADPVYTQPVASESSSTTQTQTSNVSPTYNYYDGTKATKEIKTTKETEPTTPAKNITNYGSKLRPLKWISLVLMIGSVIALIYVNVRYKKVHGSPKKGVKKGSKLDTGAKFNKPEDNAVDLSSFSKKGNSETSFKQKLVDDDFKKKNDDDLYI